MKKLKSPSKNPEQFVTIEFDLEPELIAFIEALAAKADMSPESFAGMVVSQYVESESRI
jgi:hypothetical protein